MQCIPYKTPLIEAGSDLMSVFFDVLEGVRERDIVAVSSKVVAVAELRVQALKASPKGKGEGKSKVMEYVEITGLPEGFCKLVLEEADEVLGAVPGAILTIKNNICIANAGIDMSNVEKGTAVLWPEDAFASAHRIRKGLCEQFGFTELGVMILDSHCMPLRNGTSGFALAVSGFESVSDERGKKDLYGNEMRITQRGVADMIASGANLLMGDSDEQTPVVVVRDAPVRFTEEYQEERMVIEKERDLFAGLYRR